MPIADPRNCSDFRDKRKGEEMGPTASSRPPPENGPETGRRCVWRLFSLPCVCGCVCSRFRSLCVMYTMMVSVCYRPAKSRAQNLRGTSFFFAYVSSCCLGGGSLDGGDPGSPRCLGPSRSTPEGCGAAHGPRHPAYPLLPRSLILLWGFGSHSF